VIFYHRTLILVNNILYTTGNRSTFKTRQKSSSGRLLPYEAIDKTMSKNNGNCVCFITSEKWMHAWLKAVAHILYYDVGNKPNNNVIWRDRTEKSSIVHTEFIVRSHIKN
jgi:hypothetical protein